MRYITHECGTCKCFDQQDENNGICRGSGSPEYMKPRKVYDNQCLWMSSPIHFRRKKKT